MVFFLLNTSVIILIILFFLTPYIPIPLLKSHILEEKLKRDKSLSSYLHGPLLEWRPINVYSLVSEEKIKTDKTKLTEQEKQEVEKFLSEEYEVEEKCLEIN